MRVVRSFHSLTTMELAFVRKGRFGLPFLTLFKRARTHAYTRVRVSLNARTQAYTYAHWRSLESIAESETRNFLPAAVLIS
jgi:hypothetical protein